LITHCTRCWDSRKQWAPERPRRKRKGGKKTSPSKTSPVVVAEGMDDTDGGSAIEGETDRPRSDTMSSQDSGIGSQEFEMLELTETEVASEGRPVSLDLTKLSRSISLDMTSRSSGSSTCSSSTMDTSELSELGSIPDLKQVTKVQEMCMFCEMRPRNAIFIHGKLGHQVCCYPCAKKNWKTSPNCPICKRRVEKIIKAIQA
jgi:E3 ubiquitin-protein ligase Mdm2